MTLQVFGGVEGSVYIKTARICVAKTTTTTSPRTFGSSVVWWLPQYRQARCRVRLPPPPLIGAGWAA
uniref:Uncharacterized protein n=1 Tax=Chromera velia CCMP2878 TaxID=1169474 RepID=A0A0G4FN59_9ALVE|eukprot:Cvel_17913.t1-p1 / transcript=Cvel_17913.t1 / gene=Cvel_17913 / organism=Chromera_velia_CCMP2878 / gene_product=hypothetical protein / transcript_product=hypothetical protein / location=Cvel_scaffold1455:10796-11123(-) / protein_length=66 / sequence_SO=supercontig / SO=protein_coding / is_pseudo=false